MNCLKREGISSFIGNILVGTRYFSLSTPISVVDKTNRLKAEITFNKLKEKSFSESFTSFFSGEDAQEPLDHFKFTVTKTAKPEKVICTGEGSWLGEMWIDGKKS